MFAFEFCPAGQVIPKGIRYNLLNETCERWCFHLAHVEKFSKTAVGNLFAHYERRLTEYGEPRKYKNQEIDLSKSDQNYNLAWNNGRSQLEIYKERLSQVKCLNRADVKTMCDWVITLPENLKHEDFSTINLFFQSAYDFLEERYGKENVISSYVHMDETTPHMHFSFIPVTQDKKKGHLKVSAKEVLNKYELQSFHSDLKTFVEKRLGRPVAILNGATKEGNLKVEELKRVTKEVATLEKEIAAQNEQLEEFKQMKLYNEKALKAFLHRPQTTLLSGVLGEPEYKLKKSEYLKLVKTALSSQRMRKDHKLLQQQVQNLTDSVSSLRKELEEKKSALYYERLNFSKERRYMQIQLKRLESVDDMMQENIQLQKENHRLKSDISILVQENKELLLEYQGSDGRKKMKRESLLLKQSLESLQNPKKEMINQEFPRKKKGLDFER